MEYVCRGLSLKSIGPLLLLVNVTIPAKRHLNIVHGCSLHIALKCGLYGMFFVVLYIYTYVVLYLYIYMVLQFLVHAQGALCKYQFRVGHMV